MLTPDQIQGLQAAFEQLSEPLVNTLITDIARRVSEAGQLTSTAAYEIWRAQNLGKSREFIEKAVADWLQKSIPEVQELFKQAAEVGYNFDVSRLPVEAVPFAENQSIQQVVSAAVDLADENLKNITQTLGVIQQNGEFSPLTDYYRKACDEAFMQVSAGVLDYNTAIRRACSTLAQRGIQTIDYESGVRTSLEAAVRRNMMGGLGLMVEDISRQNHDDLGCDGWEISAHAASAPDHEPIQGRQYPDEEYERLNNSLVRRIGALNCGHTASPIILGVSEPQYTSAELAEIRRQNEEGVTVEGRHYSMYEATQKQRQIEGAIRTQKRRILIDEAAKDEEKLLTDQIRLRSINEEYRRFSKAAGLPTQRERAQVAGFGKKRSELAREQSPRQKKNGDYSVDWSIIQSSEYSKKFDKLSVSEKANDAVKTRAKWALNNRDGLKTEEIYAVDMRDGSEISRITNQQYVQGVKRTEQFDRRLKIAESSGAEIMMIHNHPAGSPPSISDLNALLLTPKAQGITVGHDGSIYRYTAPKKKIPQVDFDIAYRKNMVYTNITAYERALDELSLVYGFTFEKL